MEGCVATKACGVGHQCGVRVYGATTWGGVVGAHDAGHARVTH
jgi:hypothetical protein